MKKGIHPESHDVYLVLPNGNKIHTKSTLSKNGAEISLDINPFDHPAWTGKGRFVETQFGRMAAYKQKFAGLDLG
ncbi:50S ribosomal protein L31 [Candidatus Gromoviella agglomerans]|uniref:50S ribosomal protein L31 n=1 Tax=Candidatus Gromoviella agglomerans TaxID=2806609 RepID=UPI001E5929D2|nr:50S ribosomal protein L31 [Candidatus Gromoviella agglomerans]UFX98380.1 50S ribosomal protein L31 [Candidatus Gromoviella agglomerans]